MTVGAQTYYDNETIYRNQDPDTETRRSDHFRFCFGHYNRDTGVPMTEALAQGNLQMFEHMWDRWVTEMGLHDINESATRPDGKKYKANFNVLMTWNDGGGGGAYSSMDANGFAYAMANTTYLRYDPPSGATPHEMGHAWEGAAAGFNGSDSSGMWWECTANWMMLQFNNSYPQAAGYIYNGNYYPAHGRHFYDNWPIWEAARDDSRYGARWVNRVWTDATAYQAQTEYMLDRMIRCDTSGSADKAGAVKDLWGDMTKKMVTWDFERQQWLKAANKADNGSDWEFYQRTRTPLVKMPGTDGWYRPSREHIPQEFGFNYIMLSVSPNTTVSCNFQPLCDPVRQSDWRACLVAVNNNGEARYSCLWNKGVNSITLSGDESKLYLAVIATPKPMKIADPMWKSYLTDAGLQFPYTVSFTNATPKNVVFPKPNVTWKSRVNPDGSPSGAVASTATVDATAYIGPNAMVLNSAKVLGYARIEDYAVVRNSAQVKDNAVVSGHAVIQDSAQVYGKAKVRDWARVYGSAKIYENARVIEHAYVGDTNNVVYGNAVVKGTSSVYSPSTFNGSLITDGDTSNGGTGDHGVHFGWQWGQNTSIFPNLVDNGYVYSQLAFDKDNPVFAMDQYGINHGYLMNGAKVGKDTVAPTRGGLVLPLDGVKQYVELHNSVNDWRDTAVTIWVKWSGTKWNGETDDQKIWSMGDGASKIMYLTPKDSTTGKLRFVITNGTTTQSLNGAAAIPENTWTHVAVVFSGSTFNTTTKQWSATATLYVNGASVASSAVSVLPDQLNAPLMENANYLGRDNVGNYFYGYLDDFRVYMKSLTASEVASVYSTAAPGNVTITADTTPPAPSTAGWLVAPNAISDSAITMSATPGTDASGWVEYYFACTSGNGHDSGWVSFNKYTDVGLEPGVSYTYTVKMRDKNGNTNTQSVAQTATTQTSSVDIASFAYGPVGIADGKITMTAAKVSSPCGLVEYKFDRIGSSVTSGWQSSPTWTNTGLTTGASYSYIVTVRDGGGNVTAPSSAVSTVAKDMAAPKLPMASAHWTTMPYATIDNKLCMTAMDATDPSGVQYYFHCVSGGGPDSGWLSSPVFTSVAVPDGTYVYQYKVRDKSAQQNESAYSETSSVTVSPLRGYHNYTLGQLTSLPDDYLVNFNATVVQVNPTSYVVRDLSSGASITVKPSSYAEATDSSLILKNVSVKGHLYTLSGTKLVTFATVTSTGTPTLNTISGRVTNSSGVAVAGATIYFSYTANASATPVVTATTDANGNYTKGVIDGTWYVCAGSSAYNTSTDRVVTVNGASVAGIDFSLAPNAKVTGKVVSKNGGTPLAGASVYFSRSANASGSPVFTATTDANGNFSQSVQNGMWYICSSKTGYYTSADQTTTVNSADVSNINFVIKPNTRDIPRTADLLFSAVTESLPGSGSTGNWKSYLPAGQTFTAMGTPTVDTFGGMQWVKNVYADGDGYDVGTYSSSIAVNGATIVAVVKPTRSSDSGNWRSIVDIFYDRLVLGIANNSGQVCIRRNGPMQWSSTTIPEGQATILSLVVQPDGKYKVYSNGTQIMSVTGTSTMTSLVPNVPGAYANHINIGRNNPDNWTTYNGGIGDVFVYKVALTDAERQQLEADLVNKFKGFNVSASAGNGGSISPSGLVAVNYGESQTFTITPAAGYDIQDVTVDGASVGAVSSYTFTNITANHNISATFVQSAAPVESIAELKGVASGSRVKLSANETVIYAPRNASNARSTSFFYVGEKQAMGGLKVVDKTSDTLSLGNIVSNLTGYVRKPVDGEVYLELDSNPTPLGVAGEAIAPIGISNKSALGDSKVQTNAVRLWGKVMSVNGTTSFVVSDGYNAAGVTVMVNGVALPAGFGAGKTAVVTGVVSKDASGKVVVLAQAIRVL